VEICAMVTAVFSCALPPSYQPLHESQLLP
jgi:hypothetical protein